MKFLRPLPDLPYVEMNLLSGLIVCPTCKRCGEVILPITKCPCILVEDKGSACGDFGC